MSIRLPFSKDGSGRVLWSVGAMLRFYARPFMEARSLVCTMTLATGSLQIAAIDESGRDHIQDSLSTLIGCPKKIGLSISQSRAEHLIQMMRRSDLVPQQLHNDLKHLDSLIEEELETAFLLWLSPGEAASFEPDAPAFGSDVATKFPAAIYEVEEAGRCLALGRSTAGAFHAIRCLEAAIRAMSECLGIPNPTKASDRSWFKMLKAIERKVERRWPTASDRMHGDGRVFEEAYAMLAATMNLYRNATMHLDHKYILDEARDMFAVVGGFTKKIASRCDEDGQPKLP